jgi:hypothetical protein
MDDVEVVGCGPGNAVARAWIFEDSAFATPVQVPMPTYTMSVRGWYTDLLDTRSATA